ncbi:alpha/beta fold hydrolase [Mucilaginibacter sp.]|jgi:pimeloyl-ACP methyl ester carboxylesterase|uniref:alpha/beta fold hydrolase n=1 Tax=Mucilaginibacter sp. TaxID=1882438 RepID=UPI003567E203
MTEQIIKMEGGMMTHGMAIIDAGTRIHYVEVGTGDQVIVLLHGFPQTWWEWRFIIPGLTKAGYKVIVPDYRGAGHSWRPASGYDKSTMAADIHQLLTQHLDIKQPIIMAGHDIGLMVAYAYAQQFRNHISHLVVIDAPLPGTQAFDSIRSHPRVWHFAFHTVPDLPELLISGRERQYLQSFFGYRIFNTAAISEQDIDVFTSAYSAPGAIRAGLEVYRAFDQDVLDNKAFLAQNGKLTIPVLAVGGEISTSGGLMKDMMLEVAERVTAVSIPRTAHWVVEENPESFLQSFLSFLDSNKA